MDRVIPSNVKTNINIFQTKESIVGSRGGSNTAENDNKTRVVNADVTKVVDEHSKIDEASLRSVIKQIAKVIRVADKKSQSKTKTKDE